MNLYKFNGQVYKVSDEFFCQVNKNGKYPELPEKYHKFLKMYFIFGDRSVSFNTSKIALIRRAIDFTEVKEAVEYVNISLCGNTTIFNISTENTNTTVFYMGVI